MNLTNWEHGEDGQDACTPALEVEGMHISAYIDFVKCATFVTVTGKNLCELTVTLLISSYVAQIYGFKPGEDSDHWGHHIQGDFIFDSEKAMLIFGTEEMELAKEKCKAAV